MTFNFRINRISKSWSHLHPYVYLRKEFLENAMTPVLLSPIDLPIQPALFSISYACPESPPIDIAMTLLNLRHSAPLFPDADSDSYHVGIPPDPASFCDLQVPDVLGTPIEMDLPGTRTPYTPKAATAVEASRNG
jgi:hypothetical protein